MIGGTVMELEEKTLESIGQYVRKNLGAWLAEAVPDRGLPDSVFLERLIRIEEELKAQRNLMEVRFDAADKRFEDLIHTMDKRFEAVDKRFEAIDKRFEDLIHMMDKRFEAVDKRFEAVDKRFDDLIHHMDKRFSGLQWAIGLGFTLMAGLLAVFNFF